MRRSRRSLLAALPAMGAAALLPGCGFRPVYGRNDGIDGQDAQAELGLIAVAPIPDRVGQLLRQALEDRFQRDGMPGEQRYDLSVAYSISNNGISIEPDNNPTRTQLIAVADYTLRAQDAHRTLLTTGHVHALDGLDIVDQQFFAATLNTSAANRRLAGAIADQITERLADYFDTHKVTS